MRLNVKASATGILSAVEALYRSFVELATCEQRGESMQQQSSAKGTSLRVILAASRIARAFLMAHARLQELSASVLSCSPLS